MKVGVARGGEVVAGEQGATLKGPGLYSPHREACTRLINESRKTTNTRRMRGRERQLWRCDSTPPEADVVRFWKMAEVGAVLARALP